MSRGLEARPNPSSWQVLLDAALPLLESVFPEPMDAAGRPHWTLGGGTAIALRIAHRISDDIDVFVPGVPLRRFAPHANPLAVRLSPRFQWPGHYLKFELPEGEIDLLSPPLQTEPGYDWETYKGRPIALETLEEVIVKKVRFRSATFTLRDAFDLAAVAAAGVDLMTPLVTETADALPRLRVALELLAAREVDATAQPPELRLRPFPATRDLAPRAVAVSREIVAEAMERAIRSGRLRVPAARSGG